MSSKQELQKSDIAALSNDYSGEDKVEDKGNISEVLASRDIIFTSSTVNFRLPSNSFRLRTMKLYMIAVSVVTILIVAAYSGTKEPMEEPLEEFGVDILSGRRTSEIELDPSMSENLAAVADPVSEFDTPLFWHVPKSGGTAIMNLYSMCLDLVIASQIGCAVESRDCVREDYLEVFLPFNGNSMQVVNVDTTSHDGLVRAGNLGLAESGLAEIIFTSLLRDAVDIFDSVNRARVFTVMRHPVDKAVSMFYYLQEADWEPTYHPEMKEWTIKQYANSPYLNRDWMVRGLLNKFAGEIHEADLETAKLILKEKVLIGLLTQMEESIDRFDSYFGFPKIEGKGGCVDNILHDKGDSTNRHKHPKVTPGSSDWELLAKENYFDVQLYDYAIGLFEEQKLLFNDTQDAA
mmetsp:Transcript_15789/g.24242  ORF Transcript_15789/g.24242 Transcript_15789/m.24242 type:complete len:405 (+) Transcript_15789:28-1242(+)